MKYNLDCVREILLTLEDELKISEESENILSCDIVELVQLNTLLEPKYSKEDIFYSVEKLDEAGYVTAYFEYGDGNVILDCSFVSSITFNGHEFLENVRDSKIWRKTKEIGKAAGSFALTIISEIAKTAVMGAAQGYLSSLG